MGIYHIITQFHFYFTGGIICKSCKIINSIWKEYKLMSKKLDDKTKCWMSLERATFEQRAIVEEYYDTELMQLIVKEFISHNKNKVYEKVDYMILSVGTSYEPLVLDISLFQPKKYCFYIQKRQNLQ